MRSRVEFTRPADERRFLLRVQLDGKWVGDLLPETSDERDALLRAFAAADITVATRAIPLPDVSIAEGVPVSR